LALLAAKLLNSPYNNIFAVSDKTNPPRRRHAASK
jgi:hypothetical protein